MIFCKLDKRGSQGAGSRCAGVDRCRSGNWTKEQCYDKIENNRVGTVVSGDMTVFQAKRRSVKKCGY